MEKKNYNPEAFYSSSQLRAPESYLAYDQSCTKEVHDFVSSPARSSFADSDDGYRKSVTSKLYMEQYSPEDFLNLMQQYNNTKKALKVDYAIRATTFTDETLIELATPNIDSINQYRKAISDEHNIDLALIDIDELDRDMLEHYSQPDWDAVASGSVTLPPSQIKKLSFNMKENIDELRLLNETLASHSQDAEYMSEVRKQYTSHLEVMRGASHWLAVERRIRLYKTEIDTIYKEASLARRQLTERENRAIDYFEGVIQEEDNNRGNWISERRSRINKRSLKYEVIRRKNAKLSKQFNDGLVMTESMQNVVDYLLPDLAAGRPALLVGDTGGAKTALAIHIAKNIFQKEPEIVSASVESNSSHIIGKHILRSEDGSPVSEFAHGPLLRAMQKGCPLILDEINAMPSDFLKRFNVVMQLKPGDVFTPQEDGQFAVEVQPGFCIIATANEKSRRYRGVEKLSVEFLNRFGANIQRIHYPDAECSFNEFPEGNMQIATGALVDSDGNFPDYVNKKEIEQFVRACFVSQQVFTGNQSIGFSDYRSDERHASGRPGLEESVLAPRTMAGMLVKYKSMFGKLPLASILNEYLDGVELPEDRRILREILGNYNLLEGGDDGERAD